MIIKNTEEMLVSLHGTDKIGNSRDALDALIDQATKIEDSFTVYRTKCKTQKPALSRHVSQKPMYMDDKANFVFSRQNEGNMTTDISAYALGQAASIWGIPAGYLTSLYERDLGDLAELNVRTLVNNQSEIGSYKVLESDGTVEAIVTDKYADNYPVSKVIEDVKNTVDLDKYIPNQVYLSKSRFHIRFVDFDHPEHPNGEKMSAGFTISSSNIGKSALKVNFFLYKFACRNGIVRVGKGGTLFRQVHMGERISDISIQKFKNSFDEVEQLRTVGMAQIEACQGKRISEDTMRSILEGSRKNGCNIGEKETEKIIELAKYTYADGNRQTTRWSLINGITEVAQDHSLDQRLAYEIWAGNLLKAV